MAEDGPGDGRPARGTSRPAVAHLPSGLPRRIFAQASPRSVGGVSMFSMDAVTVDNVGAATSEREVVLAAAARLHVAGFEVLQSTSTTINIAGPPALYERAFGCRLVSEDRVVIKEQAREDLAQFVENPLTDLPGLIETSGTDFAELVEGVALEEPRYYLAGPLAPAAAYWHLDVPGDVSLGCNADRAHRAGVTGRGVSVVMTDSGHFAHPFFAARGYRVGPVVLGPGASDPEEDGNGHGTAESANVFAVAPDVDFQMVKIAFTNTVGGFNAAVGLAPHVISNSWGSDKREAPLSAADNAMAAAIAAAVAAGIVVVFSAGNGHFGFPGQHPDVISAGGTYLDADGSLRASDYSSGFASSIYPGRTSPDLCGLVGMRPRASYILLPVQPNDEIDRGLAGGEHPGGDETAPDDGWAAISGTSAAAPQLAGAAALVLQACPRLTPAEVREVLVVSARDVTAGNSFDRPGMGNPAGPGPDLATGAGLVDAHRATLVAKVRCLGPASPGPAVEAVAAPAPGTAGAALSREDVASLESLISGSGPDPAS